MKSFRFLLAMALLLSACGTESRQTVTSDPVDQAEQGPWDGRILLATSEDGLSFEGDELFLERAGVPNLLMLQNGDLVLTAQYFSNTDAELFDAIVYSISKDEGQTWSEIQGVTFENLPEPQSPERKPMDPTLVQLEDGSLRLYFTYHAKGEKNANLFSAHSDSEEMGAVFLVEPEPALEVEEGFLLDPAVVFFDGLWHHFTWQMESDDNYHSTSSDGLVFELQDEISLPMDFLGQVIPFEDGLRFYGTGEGGVVSAFSEDGFSWEVDQKSVVQGADPGVQQLEDGSYIMAYTSMNFNLEPNESGQTPKNDLQ